VTASFSQTSGTPDFTSTMTISTSATSPTGTYTILINGAGGGKKHICTYELTVLPTTITTTTSPTTTTTTSPTTTTAPPPAEIPWIWVGAIVLAVIIIALVIVVRRKKK
jgi:hypothetical protein